MTGETSAAQSRAAEAVHTIIALAILLVFWGAIGYTFWPQMMPALFRSVQTVRSIGAEPVESQVFDVRNNSDASEAQARFVIQTLERDHAAIVEFLGVQPSTRIPVLITNGGGPALADGAQLNIFYDNGVMDVDTAPFFLVLLSDGQGLDLDRNLAGQGGFAVYVAEEIGRAQGVTGQSTDAWVELLRQKGGLLPLTQAWEIRLPQSEEQAVDFLRALLEAGSFVRWVAKTFGLDAAKELRAGSTVENVTGLSLAEAEEQWLAAIAAQQLKPKPCELALPPMLPQSICQKL